MSTGPIERVLVVDDSQSSLRISERVLRSVGLVVDTAINGAQAIEMLKTAAYDIVLLDYQMPVMDGADVVRWINASLPMRPQVIVQTSDERAETRTLFESLEVDEMLIKPVPLSQLMEALSAAEARAQS